MDQQDESRGLLTVLAPYLLGTMALSIVLASLLFRLVGAPLAGTGSYVTFDVVKYTNAQRAVASSFLKGTARDHAEANELLLNLTAKTRVAVAAEAGEGAVVLLKQAVVQGSFPDITDAVLTRLGLPTNVPTSDPSTYALDIAPTLLLSNPAYVPPRSLDNERPADGRVLP